MYKSIFKRIFDFVFSILSLFVLSPIFLIVYIILAIYNKGDVFFFQFRPGKNEKIFKIIKFKTMRDLYDENRNLLPDRMRVTSIGKFIRSTSLDELPQLLNVLRGEMSLIGPRPLLVEYLPLYNNTQKRRHELRPGITGWTQINGRNAVGWKERFVMDVWYVDNISFFLDFKILLLTVLKVIKRADINASNGTTLERFKGN